MLLKWEWESVFFFSRSGMTFLMCIFELWNLIKSKHFNIIHLKKFYFFVKSVVI